MKIFILTFLFLIPIILYAQKTNINPKGNWFFGAEIGKNRIVTLSSDRNNTIQGGILAEYYFARHWSLSSKVKYFDTGVSIYIPEKPSSSGSFANFFLSSGTPPYYGTFNGSVVSVPIFIKWEFRLFKNLGASFKIGYAYNFETKSEYVDYSTSLKANYPKIGEGINSGFGINYFINKNMAFYYEIESYNGASKGKTPLNTNTTQNSLSSFGIKYCFKKT